MRTQAHLEKIVKTYPIEGADAIEMAQLLDFHVVVKKNEFKAGDWAIYVEIDSILPDGLSKENLETYKALKKKLKETTDADEQTSIKLEIDSVLAKNTIPEFEFLRNKDFEIHALKYGKFKVISLGICFPIRTLSSFIMRLPEGPEKKKWTAISPKEGLDVSGLLGVTKIEDEAIPMDDSKSKLAFLDKRLKRFGLYRKVRPYLVGTKLGATWPKELPAQSDEDGAQKIYSKFYALHKDKIFYMTEKLEGQNISIFGTMQKVFFKLFTKKLIGVCSHHRYIRKPDGSGFWETVIKLGWHKKVLASEKDVFLRGEHCGPGIQKNIYNFDDRRIYLFEVYDLGIKKRLNLDDFLIYCAQNEYPMVPLLQRGFKLPPTVQEILEISNGKSFFNPKQIREGIVLRCEDDPEISMKVRSPNYLANNPTMKKPKIVADS